MATPLSIFGVAFAALCVWLAVRIVNRRERWARWTLAALIGLPVAYFASFGPACWLADRDLMSRDLTWLAYDPLASFLAICESERIREVLIAFGEWGGGQLEFPRQPTARLIIMSARGTGLIATVSIVFAAFCVWMAVRIINQRERWAKWTAAIAPVAVATAYPIAYLLFMEPIWTIPSFAASSWERYPDYRINFARQETAQEFFGPVHRLDRAIRPKLWGEKRPWKGGKHPDEVP